MYFYFVSWETSDKIIYIWDSHLLSRSFYITFNPSAKKYIKSKIIIRIKQDPVCPGPKQPMLVTGSKFINKLSLNDEMDL